jgi:hypothetical protein
MKSLQQVFTRLFEIYTRRFVLKERVHIERKPRDAKWASNPPWLDLETIRAQ